MFTIVNRCTFTIATLIEGGTAINMSWPLFLLIIAGQLLAIALVLFLPTQHSLTSAVFRDDDRHCSGADFLYNNPDDPAVFVPKRYSSGWTVNFGHSLGKLIMIATLLS